MYFQAAWIFRYVCLKFVPFFSPEKTIYQKEKADILTNIWMDPGGKMGIFQPVIR